MRDDHIRDLLRTLEDDRAPDPAFADELHATLAGMSHRGSRRWRLVLLAAAAVLALAGGAALGSGLIDPPVTAKATPTPFASVAPSATETPSPAASVAVPSQSTSPSAAPETPGPTPTPDQATALGLPPGLLPAGSVVRATADGIRIREAPSTNAAIVATAAAGDAIYIEAAISAGPVSADGYDWYQVAYAGGADIWPWQDVVPDEATMYATGWMASGSATERFVRLPEVACPTEPITLSVLAFELTDWERLVCLGDSPITIEGTYGCDRCGGVTPGAEPAWLADQLIGHVPIAGRFMYYPFVRVAIPPDTPVPQDRDIVRATLHVNDPAAETCTYTPDPQGTTPTLDYDPIAIEVYCRERLVLESFEVIGTDDFGQ
jgi:hypothetical protein